MIKRDIIQTVSL